MNASRHISPNRRPANDDGHDVLLRTFMDFDLDGALSDPTIDPLWDLQAAVTFLTDRMLTFAVREEAQLRPGSPEREATALEHALLREEIDRFITEIGALARSAHTGSAPARRRLLRRVHRIELLLAVHKEAVLDRADSTH